MHVEIQAEPFTDTHFIQTCGMDAIDVATSPIPELFSLPTTPLLRVDATVNTSSVGLDRASQTDLLAVNSETQTEFLGLTSGTQTDLLAVNEVGVNTVEDVITVPELELNVNTLFVTPPSISGIVTPSSGTVTPFLPKVEPGLPTIPEGTSAEDFNDVFDSIQDSLTEVSHLLTTII